MAASHESLIVLDRPIRTQATLLCLFHVGLCRNKGTRDQIKSVLRKKEFNVLQVDMRFIKCIRTMYTELRLSLFDDRN